MNIIFPVISLQQANNIRAQVGLPLLTAWSPKDFTLRDITPAQSSDLVQFVTPAQQPPAPTPGPNPTMPTKIDGYRVVPMLNMAYGRTEVGDLRGVALVTSPGPGIKQISLSEYGGPPLNREYWMTSDLTGTPQWKNGGPSPSVQVTAGQFVVFRNKPGTPSKNHPDHVVKLDGTPSAVSAG